MRIPIAAAARRLGVEPNEQAVRAALAEDAQHDAFMAQHFPQVRASLARGRIAASTPTEANEKRAAMNRIDEGARRDPFTRPGSIRPVVMPPASASSTYAETPLPGFGAPASFGRPGEVRNPPFTRA
jgi:hypothetical protein